MINEFQRITAIQGSEENLKIINLVTIFNLFYSEVKNNFWENREEPGISFNQIIFNYTKAWNLYIDFEELLSSKI